MAVRPNGNGNGSGSGTGKTPNISLVIAAAGIVLTFIAQTWYLAGKQATIEAISVETERRVGILEQLGSPSIQPLKTEILVASKRLDNLDQTVGLRVPGLLVQDAQHSAEILALRDEEHRMMAEVALLQASREGSTDRVNEVKARLSAVESVVAERAKIIAEINEDLRRLRQVLGEHTRDDVTRQGK